MGRLFLVRHAQASFLSQNYDQLSSLGEMQSRLLGEYWAKRKFAFDRIYCGPGLRHRHTAQLVEQAYRKAGLFFPEQVIVEEFDEFAGDAVLASSLPQLLPKSLEIRELHDVMQNSADDAAKRRNFQRLFEIIISKWVSGELAPANVESWEHFCIRVNRGLSDLLAQSRKGEVSAIFTSGGPLSVAVQRALQLSAEATLQIAWMSRNCSFSEFLFSGNRFMLSSFNAFPHLDGEPLLSYR
jgi:broad specificity phosphatase PhoE